MNTLQAVLTVALFDGEDLPEKGKLKISQKPGFGMTLRDRSVLQKLPE